jgi:hypothetical protein
MNITTNVNIINNCSVVPFNQTDYDAVFELYRDSIINNISKNTRVFANLIQKAHFNPELPQNHNIKITNANKKFMSIYDGNDFKKIKFEAGYNLTNNRTMQSITNELDKLENGNYLLNDKYKKMRNNLQIYLNKMNEINGKDDYLKTKYEIGTEDEVMLVIYNNTLSFNRSNKFIK